MLRIIVERAGEVLHDLTFRKDLISIGREGENDLVLSAETISARHLVLKQEAEGNGYRLFDQSSNGTWFQGERVEVLRFEMPTTFVVGEYHLTMIPVKRTGTLESSAADLFRRTMSDALPEEAAPTAEHARMGPVAGRPGPAELRAVAINGELKSLVFEGAATVGRAADCDLRFDSRDVSRRHCVLTATEGGYTIRRLSETNRLVVNDRELPRGATLLLRDGDVIRVCDEEILFLHPATRDAEELPSIPSEGTPNLDLAVSRRSCVAPSVMAFDVVGFLGAKTFPKFEDELRAHFNSSAILLDLGYLVGLDGAGVASVGRMLKEASDAHVAVQIIRVTPRIADLLSFSALKQIVTEYIAPSEEIAIRKLLGR